jgi:hypothetical protein
MPIYKFTYMSHPLCATPPRCLIPRCHTPNCHMPRLRREKVYEEVRMYFHEKSQVSNIKKTNLCLFTNLLQCHTP